MVFCTGGNRSGKSAFALRLFDGFSGRKVFVGTAEPVDADMAARIQRHRDERGGEWSALDLPMNRALELPAFLLENDIDGSLLCLDCLGTWVSAAMHCLAGPEGAEPRLEWEERICGIFSEAVTLLRERTAGCVLVSVETGLGIVPADRTTRIFRDIIGRVNQIAAACSDESYLLISSMPIRIK